jgi:ribonuclease HI
LVKQIYSYLTIEFNNFDIVKVKGHNGNLGNEIADALATFDKAKLAKIYEDNEYKFMNGIKFDF